MSLKPWSRAQWEEIERAARAAREHRSLADACRRAKHHMGRNVAEGWAYRREQQLRKLAHSSGADLYATEEG